MDWLASASGWLSVSPSSGSLPAAATTTVTIAINANAGPLSPGTYNESVLFTNLTNGAGNTSRLFALLVNTLGLASSPLVNNGNGNGRVDPNECNVLFLPFRNDSDSTVRVVNATLSTSTPGMTIFQPVSVYPDIAPGETATNLVPFQIETSPVFACGSASNLVLTVSYAGGLQTTMFDLPSGAGDIYTISSSTGAVIVAGTADTGNHCDDCGTAITLPFPYTLYGQSYTNAIVSSNGNLEFGSANSSFVNACLPQSSFGPTIFAHWDDLYTSDSGSGQGIFTSMSGSAPNRVFNVEWRARFCCSGGAPDLNFEIRLYEGQQRFDIIYGNVNGNGNGATVGVQAGTNAFTSFECNAGGLTNGLQVTFETVSCTDGGGQCDNLGDGIPIWWRQQYFGGDGTTTDSFSCALCDPDGDGQPNLQEYLAGTDPTNSLSVFRITAIEKMGGNVRVSFTSVSGKYYSLDRCNFMGGPSGNIVDNVPGNNGIQQATDLGGGSQGMAFYRVRLNPSGNPAGADSDGDGIPDSWMQLYFGHPTGQAGDHSLAVDDPDGDGFSNLQEYITGTDPTNNASAFRIISVAREGSNIRVTWNTGGGKTNVLQAVAGLVNSGYTTNFLDLSGLIIIPGSGDTTTNAVDAGGATNAPSRYYRVRLVP